MQIGFNLPNRGRSRPSPHDARIAVEGEAMGYDYLTLTDHVVLPDTSVPGYPYSEIRRVLSRTRRPSATSSSPRMAFIAAKTSRIRLVLAVLVVPHRPAVLAAKMLATHRRAVRRAAGRRHRRRLAEGRVRCGRHHARSPSAAR